MPSSRDIGATLPRRLIPNRKRAYIEDMAKPKTPKDSLSDQIIAAAFPTSGSLDLEKLVELANDAPPPKGMRKDVWRAMLADAGRAGFALAQAESKGATVPTEVEDILRFISSQPVAASAFKELRTKLRITQAEIAKHAGVVRSVVAEWERGRVSLPFKGVQALCTIMASRVTEPPLLTGNDIVSLRKLLGMTQVEMAAAVGTTSITIGKWEKFGERPLTREASAKVREHPECAAKLAEIAYLPRPLTGLPLAP